MFVWFIVTREFGHYQYSISHTHAIQWQARNYPPTCPHRVPRFKYRPAASIWPMRRDMCLLGNASLWGALWGQSLGEAKLGNPIY